MLSLKRPAAGWKRANGSTLRGSAAQLADAVGPGAFGMLGAGSPNQKPGLRISTSKMHYTACGILTEIKHTRLNHGILVVTETKGDSLGSSVNSA